MIYDTQMYQLRYAKKLNVRCETFNFAIKS